MLLFFILIKCNIYNRDNDIDKAKEQYTIASENNIIEATNNLAGLFFEDKKLPRLLALVDRSSYLIYLCHVLFIYMANAAAKRLGIFDMTGALVFRFVFVYY